MSSPLFDPSDPAFAAKAIDVYRVMRNEQPVYFDPAGDFVALSRSDDVRAAAMDWKRFSSTGKAEVVGKKPTLNSMDPPEHTDYRGLLSRAFTPRRVSELEPSIRLIATDLIDGFVDSGTVDAVDEFAQIFPSEVMGRLLGIPADLIPVCRGLTDASKRRTTPTGGNDAAHRSYEIFGELYQQRREEPTSDLLTALLDAEVDGRRLTEDELLGFSWLLLVGGNDTTTNLIANGLEALAGAPGQRSLLVEDPSIIANAVEEFLRIASPTHTSPRRAAVDIELHGSVIPANSRVLLLWSAANHDEREFENPDELDVRRDAHRHLSLGQGAHFCMGASLTRLETRVAFEEFLGKIPDYRIVGEPERLVSSIFSGFEHLVIEW